MRRPTQIMPIMPRFLAAYILLTIAHADPLTCNASSLAVDEQQTIFDAFNSSGIVPDLIPCIQPTITVDAAFGSAEVELGNYLLPNGNYIQEMTWKVSAEMAEALLTSQHRDHSDADGLSPSTSRLRQQLLFYQLHNPLDRLRQSRAMEDPYARIHGLQLQARLLQRFLINCRARTSLHRLGSSGRLSTSIFHSCLPTSSRTCCAAYTRHRRAI